MNQDVKSPAKAKPNKKHKISEIKNELYWWLNYNRPFVIDGKYSINLVEVSRKSASVKIVIKNIENPDAPQKEIDILDLLKQENP